MKDNRRTQEERSAATRDALIRAARPLFAESGFAGVGTEAIVRAAGVTRGAMYHQFADKTELFAAVCESVEAEITEWLAGIVAESGQSDPLAAMKLGARSWLQACTRPEIYRIILIDPPSVLGWERWREIGLRYGMGLVQGMLSYAMQVGRIEPQPVAPLAHIVLGAIDEAALYVAQAADPAQALADVSAAVDRLIDAFAVQP